MKLNRVAQAATLMMGLMQSPAFAHNYDDANDKIYSPVTEDGPRCADLSIPNSDGGAACQQNNADDLSAGCVGMDTTVLSILNAKGLVAGCQLKNGKLQFAYTCLCGCFHPETLIDVLDSAGKLSKVRAAEVALASSAFSLLALDEAASLSNLSMQPSAISKTSYGPSATPLVGIALENGTILKVTTEHGILLGTGEMIQAKALKLGQLLVTREGTQVRVTGITREAYAGGVYNFATSGSTLSQHVIVANDILVGDLAWQNELQDQIGAVIIRQ